MSGPPNKIWRLSPPSPAAAEFGASLGVSAVIADLLIKRDISETPAARLFLQPDLKHISPPHSLRDIDKAVRIIKRSVAAGDKICVYGDFDCDGITAAALLYEVLREMGAVVYPFIPNRFDHGYGLHLEVIKELAAKDYRLLITVDNGITNYRETAAAKKLGLQVIITDHHQPPPILPPADAVVNPKRPDCDSPFKELAGVGVAFKLGQALAELDSKVDIESKLDLAAIGTVADIVPLMGENRVLAATGIGLINRAPRPGLAALIKVAGLNKDKITAGRISYMLAPRFNAAGRLASARYGLKLLLAKDRREAEPLAQALNNYNRQRQKIEDEVFLQAVKRVEEEGMSRSKALILSSPAWHPGVCGIVAARLVEKYNRPVLLLTEADGVLKGSGRSIPGVDIFALLNNCRRLLSTFGGHAAAAGVSLKKENLPAFCKAVNTVLAENSKVDDYLNIINIDAALELGELSENLYRDIEMLAPFGKGNPAPKFVTKGVRLAERRQLGKGDNLRLQVRANGDSVKAVGFRLNNFQRILNHQQRADIVYQLGRDKWNSQTLQLRLIDIKLHDS